MQSFQTFLRPLSPPKSKPRPQRYEFLHIPKTGGSSIEESLKDVGILAGRHDRAQVKKGTCNWHSRNRADKTSHTWCVVREPLARFVSEHNYRARDSRNANFKCTAESLNSHVDDLYASWPKNKDRKHCHYVPQSEYDCDTVMDIKQVESFVRDELHEPDFVLGRSNVSKCKLTPDDLSERSKGKLREMYSRDVELWKRAQTPYSKGD